MVTDYQTEAGGRKECTAPSPEFMVKLADNVLNAQKNVDKYTRILANPSNYAFQIQIIGRRGSWFEHPSQQEVAGIISEVVNARLEQAKEEAKKLRAEFDSYYK